MNRLAILAAAAISLSGFIAGATTKNVAPLAKASVSDCLSENYGASCLNDGIILMDGKGEWACKGNVLPWGIMHLPKARLEWASPVTVDRVVLYDRIRMDEHLSGGTLRLGDGTSISVTAIPNDGSPKTVSFPPTKVSWIEFEATDGAGKDIGLSEIEVFEALKDDSPKVEWADPWIETTCGRWFFCTPGARPMGMVAAHAFTRNKNQGGGGYNYNFDEILGFTQINDWMISGPDFMPVTGDTDLSDGMDGWKSKFSHESEIIRPGYHRLHLDRYNIWVEYTATDRCALYRLKYNSEGDHRLIVDCGSVLGNCTMRDAVITVESSGRLSGSFKTTDRFWGGPDNVNLYFTLESDTPFKVVSNIPGKGVTISFEGTSAKEVIIKAALSYTSTEAAIANLRAEAPGWDFDAVAEETAGIWNEMLSRIEVRGGAEADKVKFYTDLWHVLLGRHKINDIGGTYPDYTAGPYIEKRTSAPMQVRRLPMQGGMPKFNMYGFDALWLTQWNLNVLWGLAWPEILDDLSACLVQYALNGGLLPRGACAGGYSFIMTGCPATNLIVSTFMKDMMTLADPMEAFRAIKKNHLPGGMMSYENPDDLRFYIKNGYCPGNAGKTVEWAFQDWGAAQMAKKLGLKADAREFARRSHGWKKTVDPETGFLFPKDASGKWIHRDPLDGNGWIEANSWQGSWGLSHDLDALAALMGGDDRFCERLDYAFRKASEVDFIYDYSGGYVSYANQPGCSDAHVFSYAGKPWLTQYWVRQVRQRAYGGITPDQGYGGHDEDQGQMGGVSALMSIGLFSVTGTESAEPYYDITTPIFDEVEIRLSPTYHKGKTFVIRNHGNSPENHYIQRATFNGKDWKWSQISHQDFSSGGVMELWTGPSAEESWGERRYSLGDL